MHGAGDRRTNQEVTLYQENTDIEGLGSIQGSPDLRDSSRRADNLGHILEVESRREERGVDGDSEVQLSGD